MIEVVLFPEEADPEPPRTAEPPVSTRFDEEPVGIFVDVEDGDPLGPTEEVVLDVAVI
jgi:hypothetical protein